MVVFGIKHISVCKDDTGLNGKYVFFKLLTVDFDGLGDFESR